MLIGGCKRPRCNSKSPSSLQVIDAFTTAWNATDEVVLGKKIWQESGQMAMKETIDVILYVVFIA
jgi:hypothetical protein